MVKNKRQSKSAVSNAQPRKNNSSGAVSLLKRLEDKLVWWMAAAVFALCSFIYMIPVSLNPAGSILGRFSEYYGDVFAAIWELWVTKDSLFHGSSPLVLEQLAGPYAAYWYSFLAAHKYNFIMVPVTAMFGPVMSFNIFTWLNFVLGGFCTWLLVRKLTGSSLAGLISGLLFAFSPYAYARSIVHMDLAAIWPIPLVIYAVIRLDSRRDLAGWAIMFLSLVLFHSYCSIYYYLFFPLIVLAYVIIKFTDSYLYRFEHAERIQGGLGRISAKSWIITAAGAFILAVAGYWIYTRYLGPMAAQLNRPIHWQERFKLSWANYLIPGVDHPLFGEATRSIVPIRRNVTESTAYLGWSLILPAIIGFSLWRRDWRAWMLLVFGLGSLVFTLGPYLTLGGLKIPMPSILLHELAPFVRVISRYCIFFQLSLAAFAGYGFLRIISGGLGGLNPVALIVAFLLVGFVEFQRPTDTTALLTNPEESPDVYAKLAAADDSAMVFEYPPAAVSGLALGDYLYWQTVHHKTLFNRNYDTTTIPGKYLPFWEDLDYPGALSDPNNVRLLKFFGTDYVIYHDRSRMAAPSLPTVDTRMLVGLLESGGEGDSRIYRVQAEPATVMLSFETRPYYNYLEIKRQKVDAGFDPPMTIQGVGWRILERQGSCGILSLLERAQKVVIEMNALSVEKPRKLEVTLDGAPLFIGENRRRSRKDYPGPAGAGTGPGAHARIYLPRQAK